MHLWGLVSTPERRRQVMQNTRLSASTQPVDESIIDRPSKASQLPCSRNVLSLSGSNTWTHTHTHLWYFQTQLCRV